MNASTIDLSTITVLHGNHKPPKDPSDPSSIQACALEWVSVLAGESWSDHPECACPVLARLVIARNDRFPRTPDGDAARTTMMRRVIPMLLNSRSTLAVETRRRWMILDWLFRVETPTMLRLAGLGDHADKLAALPEIVDREGARAARTIANDVATAARAKRSQSWEKLRDGAAAADAYAYAAAAAAAYAYAAADAAAYAYAYADAYDYADADAYAYADAYADAYAYAAAYAAYAAAYAADPSVLKRIIEAAKSGGYTAAKKAADATIGVAVREKLKPAVEASHERFIELVQRLRDVAP